MRAIQKCDDELVSDSSEMKQQESQRVSWRKPLVVGICVALVGAAMVALRRMQVGLGELAQNELIDLAGCSSDTENCMKTKCCNVAGRKCFMKNEYWSNCNEKCDPNHVDDWDKAHGITDGWNCTALKKGECAKDHEDCTGKDGCCSEGHICFIKNKHWKNCNKGCKIGVGANEYEHKDYGHESWSCEIHELGRYCPEANINKASDPKEHLKCCKDAFCKGKTDEDCKKSMCAFYYNANTKPAKVLELQPHKPKPQKGNGNLVFPLIFEGLFGVCPPGFTCYGQAKVCVHPAKSQACFHPGIANLQGDQYFDVGHDFIAAHAISRVFYMPSDISEIQLLYSGGAYVKSGFFLHTLTNGRIICHIANGKHTNAFMQESCVGLQKHGGEPVFICVVDAQQTHWGKVLIDNIRLLDQFGGDLQPAGLVTLGPTTKPDCKNLHADALMDSHSPHMLSLWPEP